MRAWHYDKIKENDLIRMDKVWSDRIKKHNLSRCSPNFVFKKLWGCYPLDRSYLKQVGYSLKKEVLNRKYVSQLLKKIKEEKT